MPGLSLEIVTRAGKIRTCVRDVVTWPHTTPRVSVLFPWVFTVYIVLNKPMGIQSCFPEPIHRLLVHC